MDVIDRLIRAEKDLDRARRRREEANAEVQDARDRLLAARFAHALGHIMEAQSPKEEG